VVIVRTLGEFVAKHGEYRRLVTRTTFAVPGHPFIQSNEKIRDANLPLHIGVLMCSFAFLLGTVDLAEAQSRFAVVIQDAPIMLLPDAKLHVAPAGTRLVSLGVEGSGSAWSLMTADMAAEAVTSKLEPPLC
jgi:hypothetical protein